MHLNRSMSLATLMKLKSRTVERFAKRCLLYRCHSLHGLIKNCSGTMPSVTYHTSGHDPHIMPGKPARCCEVNLISKTSQGHNACVDQNLRNLNKLMPGLQANAPWRQPVRHFSTSGLKCVSVNQPEALVSNVVTTDVASSVHKLYFSEFPTIQGAEKFLEYLHNITGLPWWATIFVSGFFMRGLLLIPVSIHTQKNQSRLQALGPEVKEKALVLKAEVSRAMGQFGWDEKRAKKEYNKNMSRILKEMYIRDNCHPMKNVAVFWIQTPVFLSVSYALRNIVSRSENINMGNHEVFKSLSTEGLAWVPDLTSVDTTYILPAFVFLVTLFNIEFAFLNLPAITTYRKWLNRVLRVVSVVTIPISSFIPSAVVLYWISSGFVAAVQNMLFEYSAFRRLCKLPQTPTESSNPFKSLSQKARTRYFSKEN